MQQLGTEGPMGRSVADVARLLQTQAGFDPRSPLSINDDPGKFDGPLQRDFKGTHIGWLGDFDGYLPMEQGVMALCESALADFVDLGDERGSIPTVEGRAFGADDKRRGFAFAVDGVARKACSLPADPNYWPRPAIQAGLS